MRRRGNFSAWQTRYFGYHGNMEITDAVQILGALAQDARLAVLRLLVSAGPSGLPAGVIAERLGLPSSTASFHLSALERAGLTQSTRQSRQIIHAVRIAALRDLIVFLTETCCSGRPEICGDIARLLPDIPEESGYMTPAFNVLFLCTKNSGRSIMAEAILDKIGGGKFNVYSAGSDPADEPVPDIIEKLRILGHDVSRLRSKSWHEFTGPEAPQMDFVIALCDTLEGQSCPDFGDKAVTGAWPLPDPAKFTGTGAERSTMLNELYASLHRRLGIFTSLPFASLDRMAARARLDDIGAGPVGLLARNN
jgi:ArsR family transcriptional regulator, arsenate/arsenite/antimonite-responsive transcriptional repressor / arsenate reductase (thioredoxin)